MIDKHQTIATIKELREKIGNNTADINDYKTYVELIDQNGSCSSKEMLYQLRKYGYNSWEEFIKFRDDRKTKSGLNPIVGTMLSFSLSMIKK